MLLLLLMGKGSLGYEKERVAMVFFPCMALPRRGDSLSSGAWTAPTVGTCTGSRVTHPGKGVTGWKWMTYAGKGVLHARKV